MAAESGELNPRSEVGRFVRHRLTGACTVPGRGVGRGEESWGDGRLGGQFNSDNPLTPVKT